MATATVAYAAGAAALLYYTLNRKVHSNVSREHEDESGSDGQSHAPLGNVRVSHRLIRAPGTWLETISTLSETLRFTYSETLGKWPIGDLAFGISFLLKRQGNLHVSNIFSGEDSLQLKGSEITAELKYLLHLLTLCWHFSKKPFALFLQEIGYSKENVLLQEPKAGILKPAFTVLVDHEAKCFLLLIRGTHSIKDTLTAATGAVVPFHHTVMCEGGVSDLALGYAHCGMVAAARWIAKLAAPCLIKGLDEHSDYKIKIVGHSLGGGTAALLTYILREQQDLSTTTCLTFAPAACMTWDLAESGNDFITTVINGSDLVPTFSAASVDDLRAEVTASAWLNDLRNQIEQTRILSTVYRSATALGSRLPSIASAKARVAGAGAILRPVSNGTQVVMKRAQSMAHAAWTRPSLRLSSWSCIGHRHRAAVSHSNTKIQDQIHNPSFKPDSCEPLVPSSKSSLTTVEDTSMQWSSDKLGLSADVDADMVDIDVDLDNGSGSHEDRMTEVELWQQLEHELRNPVDDEEIREEAEAIAEVGENEPADSVSEMMEVHRFFPPGKIMHIVTLISEEADHENESTTSRGSGDGHRDVESDVGIFLTPRSLYSKLRLSQTMISDHFMPAYRRQIEKVLSELEKEAASVEHVSKVSGDGPL